MTKKKKPRNPYSTLAKKKRAGVIKPRKNKRPKSKKQIIEEQNDG
jgi:hypothetical protein